jgi:hypothetical protein
MLIILGLNLYRTYSEDGRNRNQTVALIIRLMIFSLLGMIAVAVSTLFLFNRSPGLGSDLVIAVIPPLAALIFGSQKDFLQLWSNMFLRYIQLIPCTCKRVHQGPPSHSEKDEHHSPVIVEMEIVSMSHVDNNDGVFLIPPKDH